LINFNLKVGNTELSVFVVVALMLVERWLGLKATYYFIDKD
jgi:hypothetical protein